jgi:hypothetical protein
LCSCSTRSRRARDQDSGTLDAAVRAAASLARGHLARRDRVALVDFGGTLHWLEPALGARQLYRIVDALLASEIAFSYAWRAVESIPRRLLPPEAMIVAISQLLDERSIRLIVELRTRGCDLTVVEVSPITQSPPGSARGDVLAHRLWRLERDALRARLRALGIGVAAWDGDDQLAPALEEVNAFRRSMRPLARFKRLHWLPAPSNSASARSSPATPAMRPRSPGTERWVRWRCLRSACSQLGPSRCSARWRWSGCSCCSGTTTGSCWRPCMAFACSLSASSLDARGSFAARGVSLQVWSHRGSPPLRP